MKHGDFTELAKFYVNRPGYSLTVLKCLRDYIFNSIGTGCVSDIGAGTGKLTENLQKIGLEGYAVEPNDKNAHGSRKVSMGKICLVSRFSRAYRFEGQQRKVGVNGFFFHWTDYSQAMKEFYRILVPGGFFTAIWNPRDIESSELHKRIEYAVYSEVPGMKRVSSGKSVTTEEMKEKMLGGNYFKNIIFMEAPHTEIMTKQRYMDTWKSVNDIQVQAGEEGFQRILNSIENIIKDFDEIEVPYLSRAWTVQSCKISE